MSTIFLDRDGVINENRSDYVKSWSEFRFLPESCEAIAKLTQAGHRIIVCTNQAGVARGKISVEAVEDIHRRMIENICDFGGKIEKVYYCPHDRGEDCSCRKPRPGMLLQARDELDIDMRDAVFIGDSITDIRAGLAAGIHGVLVLSGLGLDQFREHQHEVHGPFRIGINLMHATELVLKGLHLSTEIQTSLERACYSFLGLTEQLDPRRYLEEYTMHEVTLTF
ncbi:MAG: D-glycero-beta-D-manno-heptose 1,7-bisphosphate 7-phosphatase [Ktedonobacteraceae bacterium]